MIIPIRKGEKGLENLETTEIETQTFQSMGLKESHLEEYIRTNIDILFEEEEESLLVVGQQVVNKGKGRCDLVAVDAEGNLVLIEIKADPAYAASTKEPFEFQAIRYAANLANIATPEELVNKIFVPYVKKHISEFSSGSLTEDEIARRNIRAFMAKYNFVRTFNQKQRIVLVSPYFDPQAISACAWLIKSGVDITCIQIQPIKINEQMFLQVDRILPLQDLDDILVDVADPVSPFTQETILSKRANLPKMPQLLAWGIIKKGDTLRIKSYDNSEVEVIDAYHVKFPATNGRSTKYINWGKKVTRWSSINIYEWAEHVEKNKTLAELRREKLEELESD